MPVLKKIRVKRKLDNGKISNKTIIVREYSPHEIRKRWSKKKSRVQTLAKNIRSLRYNVTSDMNSEDEKVMLTACVIRLMDMTAERVGNDNSAANGHRGITGLLKSQVKIDGNTIHLKYTGKSGVKQDKTVTDEKLSESLAKALTLSKSKYLFCTSDGFKIKNDRINRYLSDFQVTAKDLRGFAANKWLIQKLKAYDIAEEEKERKKEFNRLAKLVAAKVGHGTTMLKNQYLVPGLEDQYIKHGNIIDIHDIDSYKRGGQIVKKKKSLSISAEKRVDKPLKKDSGEIATDRIKKIDTLSAGGGIFKTNIPIDLFEVESDYKPFDLFE